MPSRIAIVTHKAALDLEEIAFYYRQLKPVLETRFIKDANSTIDRIKMMPTIGSPLDLDPEQSDPVRFCRLKSFPKYLVFYRPFDQHIEIVRVLHSSRAWQDMLHDDE
ncbi:MAG: type II toxin-antitoxin system RelE/ParE family toxin [Gemmatales bacterium]